MAWSDEMLRDARDQAKADRQEHQQMQIRMEKRAADKAWKAGAREREQQARIQKQEDDKRLEEMRLEERRRKDAEECYKLITLF